jgi:hypothetical protein
VADLTTVVGVGGSTANGKAQVVTSHDAVNIAAADAAGCLGSDAAGAHGTDAAANAVLTKLTMRSLVLHALLPGIRANLTAGFQQSFGSGFHLLDSDQFHSRNVENTEYCVFAAPFSRDDILPGSIVYLHNTSFIF